MFERDHDFWDLLSIIGRLLFGSIRRGITTLLVLAILITVARSYSAYNPEPIRSRIKSETVAQRKELENRQHLSEEWAGILLERLGKSYPYSFDFTYIGLPTYDIKRQENISLKKDVEANYEFVAQTTEGEHAFSLMAKISVLIKEKSILKVYVDDIASLLGVILPRVDLTVSAIQVSPVTQEDKVFFDKMSLKEKRQYERKVEVLSRPFIEKKKKKLGDELRQQWRSDIESVLESIKKEHPEIAPKLIIQGMPVSRAAVPTVKKSS